MFRSLLFLLLAAPAFCQHGSQDPAFDTIPFDKWLSENNQAHFHWSVNVPHAELSFHQRLATRVAITVDGRDFATRRREGEFVYFLQITDANGARYQNHGSIEINKLDENVKAANLELAQPALFLPGDYRLEVAILDTATHEHNAARSQFRIPSPRHEFLPAAWRDLPPVEFIEKEQSPDSWYLPEIRGQLEWASAVHSPARLDVILNLATSVTTPRSRPVPSAGLPALLPTLKALAQTGSASITENIDVLDLSRRRSPFHQDDVHDLNWDRLKSSLGDANNASIDIASLSQQHQDAQFFLSSVRKLLRRSEHPSVLVILTTPVAFASGENLEPISLESLPPVRVFYIRYHAPVPIVPRLDRRTEQRGRGFGLGRDPMAPETERRDPIDNLESTLKPLRPKIFDLETPEQITGALVDIEKALRSIEAR